VRVLASAQRETDVRACTKLLFIGGSCKAWHSFLLSGGGDGAERDGDLL